MTPLLPIQSHLLQSFTWQDKAVDALVAKFPYYRGAILQGGTGIGKMYVKAAAVRKLLEAGLLQVPEGSINPFPILWLCPKSVKTQTQRVLQIYGIAHLVMLYSYGELKTSNGTTTFITYQTVKDPFTGNEIDIIPSWNSEMLPAMLVCDECHVLKNPSSLQSKVIRFAPPTVKSILATATLAQRVGDAETLLVRVGAITKYNALPATITTAPAILRDIAYPKSPSKYSPSAVQRLRDALEPYCVEMKNIRFKFPTRTLQTVIQFKTPQQRREYELAYQEYCREVAEGKRKGSSEHGFMAILVAMQKFKEKAAILRSDEMALRAIAQVKNGKQVIIGADYITVLRSVWNYLVKVHGFDRTRIAFIVGGQSSQVRQENIDKFQNGDADIILITTRSGGVGISLHHDRTTTRPRYVIVPPTWSAIDLVQYLGRAHRITSISPTIQEILWYAGTIEEERVMPYVQQKMKCLQRAITAKEQFLSVFEKMTEEELEELQEAEEKTATVSSGVDDHEEVLTGEGLESEEDEALPTSYR